MKLLALAGTVRPARDDFQADKNIKIKEVGGFFLEENYKIIS